MNVFSLIITIAFCLGILLANRNLKLILFIICLVCFDAIQISEYAFTSLRNLACICLFLSELPHIRDVIINLRGTPLIKMSIIAFIGAVIVILNSHNINSFNTLFGFIIKELIAKYFVIIYGFYTFTKINSLKGIYRILLPCTIFITIIAIISLIIGRNIWVEIFGTQGYDLIKGDRQYISSTFIYSFDYGQMCLILLLTYIYGKYKRVINRNVFIIGTVCCLFGIIFCGCRTVLATSIIGVFSFILFNYGVARSIPYYFSIILLFGAAYFSMPSVQQKADFFFSAFDDNSQISGSNKTMREGQYQMAALLIRDNILFGKGHNYFLRDLGWDKGKSDYSELAGLEGAVMSILLERGIIGTIIYGLYYSLLILYCLKYRKQAKSEISVIISIILSFLCFGNMTGELDSAMPTLLWSGIFIRLSQNRIKSLNQYGCIGYNSKL